MAYIIAGLVFLAGCAAALATEYAEYMATSPKSSGRSVWVFSGFTAVALVIALSHGRMPVW